MSRKDDRHRVVIVGGGFGGLYAAKRLRRANVDVTLIDRRNFHLFQPLLYQVATGGLSPGDITTALILKSISNRIEAANRQAAGGRAVEAGDELEKGGLSGAVRARHEESLAVLDLEIEMGQGPVFTKAFSKRPGDDGWWGRTLRCHATLRSHAGGIIVASQPAGGGVTTKSRAGTLRAVQHRQALVPPEPDEPRHSMEGLGWADRLSLGKFIFLG